MKSFSLLIVAACAMLLSADQLMAVGGPGGKPQNKGELSIQNTTGQPIHVWVRPAGTVYPETQGAIAQMTELVPAASTITLLLKNGDYDINTFDDGTVEGALEFPDDEVAPSDVDSVSLAISDITIEGEDRLIRVNMTDVLFPGTGGGAGN
jgi:hypothetical protein